MAKDDPSAAPATRAFVREELRRQLQGHVDLLRKAEAIEKGDAILTDGDGKPFRKPERSEFSSDHDFVRASHEHNQKVTNAANKGFDEGFRRGMKRKGKVEKSDAMCKAAGCSGGMHKCAMAKDDGFNGAAPMAMAEGPAPQGGASILPPGSAPKSDLMSRIRIHMTPRKGIKYVTTPKTRGEPIAKGDLGPSFGCSAKNAAGETCHSLRWEKVGEHEFKCKKCGNVTKTTHSYDQHGIMRPHSEHEKSEIAKAVSAEGPTVVAGARPRTTSVRANDWRPGTTVVNQPPKRAPRLATADLNAAPRSWEKGELAKAVAGMRSRFSTMKSEKSPTKEIRTGTVEVKPAPGAELPPEKVPVVGGDGSGGDVKRGKLAKAEEKSVCPRCRKPVGKDANGEISEHKLDSGKSCPGTGHLPHAPHLPGYGMHDDPDKKVVKGELKKDATSVAFGVQRPKAVSLPAPKMPGMTPAGPRPTPAAKPAGRAEGLHAPASDATLAADKAAAGVGLLRNLITRFRGIGARSWSAPSNHSSPGGALRAVGRRMAMSEPVAKADLPPHSQRPWDMGRDDHNQDPAAVATRKAAWERSRGLAFARMTDLGRQGFMKPRDVKKAAVTPAGPAAAPKVVAAPQMKTPKPPQAPKAPGAK